MYHAITKLRHDGFQLIVIGLDFDESRMFELLQYVRGLPRYKDVPVVCVHAEQMNLSEAVGWESSTSPTARSTIGRTAASSTRRRSKAARASGRSSFEKLAGGEGQCLRAERF